MIERLKMHGKKITKRAEKLLKTDIKYLTEGGFWVGVGKGVNIVLGLILAIGFANLLPKQAFGIYQFIFSMVAIAGAFTLTGMNIAVIQSVARGYEGNLNKGAITKLKWSTGIVIVSFGIALYYFINGNATLGTGMLIAGAFTPFLESLKLSGSFLIGKKDFKASAMLGMCRKFIPLVTILVTIFLTNNVLIILLAYFISHTLTAFLLYIQVLRVYKPNKKVDKSTISFSKHLSATQILGRIAGNIDKILLFHFLGAAYLAIYVFSINIPKQFISFFSAFQSLMIPKLSNRSIPELKKTLPRKAALAFLFLTIPTALYIFLAPIIYQTFFPQYLDSILFSQVFALTLMFLPMSLFENTLYAHLKKKELYIITTVTPTARIILLVILVPLYGIWGILGTVFITHILSSTTIFYLFRKL